MTKVFSIQIILKYFNFAHASYTAYLFESRIFLIPQIMLQLIQFGSLCPSNIFSTNLKSIFHMAVYESYIQYVRIEFLLKPYSLIFSMIFTCALLFLLSSFWIIHAMAIQNSNFSLSILPCTFILNFFLIFYNLFLIPSLYVCVANFFCEEDCFSAQHIIRMIISPVLFILIIVVHLILRFFTIDFQYNSKNLWRLKDSLFINAYPGIILILCLGYSIFKFSRILEVIANLIHLIFSLWLLLDYLIYLHFNDSLIIICYYGLTVLIVWESTINFISSMWPNMGSSIDLDLLTVSILWGVIRLAFEFHAKLKQYIMDLNFYKINKPIFLLHYLRICNNYMRKSEKNLDKKFALLSIIGRHLNSCQIVECNCKSIKKYNDWFEKNATPTLQHSETKTSVSSRTINSEKMILKESNKNFDSILSYQIALDEDLLKQLYLSFFLLTLKKMKIPDASFFFEYLDFLIYEMKNPIKALIQIQEIQTKWKKKNNIKNIILLHNYQTHILFLVKNKLMVQDLIVRKSLTEVITYHDEVENIKKLMISLTSNLSEFYKKIQDYQIIFNEVKALGIKSVYEMNYLNGTFNRLLSTNKFNSKLLASYILFIKKIKFMRKNLAELNQIKKELLKKVTLKDEKCNGLIKINSEIYDERNLVVLASMIFSQYKIVSFTKNAAEFFEYYRKEMKDLDLNSLLPMPVQKIHNSILNKKILRTNKNKVEDISHFDAHIVSKSFNIIPAHLWVKFEYFHDIGITAGALIKPLNSGRPEIILTPNGTILQLTKECEPFFPKKLFNKSLATKINILQYIPRYSLNSVPIADDCMTSELDPNDTSTSQLRPQSTLKHNFSSQNLNENEGVLFYNEGEEFSSLLDDKYNDDENQLNFEEVKIKLQNIRESYLDSVTKFFFISYSIKNVTFQDYQINYRVLKIQKISEADSKYLDFFRLYAKSFTDTSDIEPLYIHPSTMSQIFNKIRTKLLSQSISYAEKFRSLTKSSAKSQPKHVQNLTTNMNLSTEPKQTIEHPSNLLPEFATEIMEHEKTRENITKSGLSSILLIKYGLIEDKDDQDELTNKSVSNGSKSNKKDNKFSNDLYIQKNLLKHPLKFLQTLTENKFEEQAKKIIENFKKDNKVDDEQSIKAESIKIHAQVQKKSKDTGHQKQSSTEYTGDKGKSRSRENYEKRLKKGVTSKKFQYVYIIGAILTALVLLNSIVSQFLTQNNLQYIKKNIIITLDESVSAIASLITNYFLYFFYEDGYTTAESSINLIDMYWFNLSQSEFNNFYGNFYGDKPNWLANKFSNYKIDIPIQLGNNLLFQNLTNISILSLYNFYDVEFYKFQEVFAAEGKVSIDNLNWLQHLFWIYHQKTMEIMLDIENTLQINLIHKISISQFVINFILTIFMNTLICITFISSYNEFDHIIYILTKIESKVSSYWITYFSDLIETIKSIYHDYSHQANKGEYSKLKQDKTLNTKRHNFQHIKIKRPRLRKILLIFFISLLVTTFPILINFLFDLKYDSDLSNFIQLYKVVTNFRLSLATVSTSTIQVFLAKNNLTFFNNIFQEDAAYALKCYENYQIYLSNFSSVANQIHQNSTNEAYAYFEQISYSDYCLTLNLSSEYQTRCSSMLAKISSGGILAAATELNSYWERQLLSLGTTPSFSDKLDIISNGLFKEYIDLNYFILIVCNKITVLVEDSIQQFLSKKILLGIFCICFLFFTNILYFCIAIRGFLHGISNEIYLTNQIFMLLPQSIIDSNNYIKNYIKTRFNSE